MGRLVCSVVSGLEIVEAGRGEYYALSRFHYRSFSLGPYVAVYAIKERHPVRSRFVDVVGVIVYTMPSINSALRSVATGRRFVGFGDRSLSLRLVNKNIRNISRVIIEPRYRGLGLASWLVRETMGRLDSAIVEATAVMGNFHPFFEQAGMTAYHGEESKRCLRMVNVFGRVGIGEEMLIDPARVQGRLDELGGEEGGFVEGQIRGFLQSYGRRKHMSAGLERTRYVLSKLGGSGVYYIWFNPAREVVTAGEIERTETILV